MRWLVTAGGTLAPIDRVRGITNSFTGRTGAAIAVEAFRRGESVTLLTSQPHAVAEVADSARPEGTRWNLIAYRTFAELQEAMQRVLTAERVDCVVHSAAVSDYLSGGVFAPTAGTAFRPEDASWRAADVPRLAARTAGKVRSDEPELWLRLVKAPKLIDLVRTEWGFPGILVKFKLEVDATDDELLAIAERSRRQSRADLMVANTLEGAGAWAFLGPLGEQYHRVSRGELPGRLYDAIRPGSR